MKRHVFLGAASLSLAAGFASAGGLQPIEAARLDLGSVSGVVYYSEAADGFHVVATLVEGQAQPGGGPHAMTPGPARKPPLPNSTPTWWRRCLTPPTATSG